MREIHLATTSQRKYANLVRHLEPYNAQQSDNKYKIKVVHHDIELPEPTSPDLRVIVGQKVMDAYNALNRIGLPCIAWDIGFYIDSLNGFPGTLVHRVLERLKDTSRAEEVILNLVGNDPRECEFRNCLAYFDGEHMAEPKYFDLESTGGGVSRGTLADKPRGPDTEWALHRIFIPQGLGQTVAEIIAQGTEKYWEYRQQRYGEFFEKIADWINERHDWLEH